MKNKLMLILSILILTLTLSACSKKEEGGGIVASDGGPLTYSESDLVEGIFAMKGKKFQALLNPPPAAQSASHIWFTGYDKAIPVVEKGDKLVLYSEEAVPSELEFVKLNDFGYTLGIMFPQATEDGRLTFPTTSTSYNPNSPVFKHVSSNVFTGSPSAINIKEVNGKEFKETMLSVDGFMKGLTKDAMYKFYYYQGTVYKDVNIKADTHVFLKDYVLPSGSYDQLKDKTFVVNLPSSIETGYWYIEGYGMFKYEDEEKSVIQDGTILDKPKAKKKKDSDKKNIDNKNKEEISETEDIDASDKISNEETNKNSESNKVGIDKNSNSDTEANNNANSSDEQTEESSKNSAVEEEYEE